MKPLTTCVVTRPQNATSAKHATIEPQKAVPTSRPGTTSTPPWASQPYRPAMRAVAVMSVLPLFHGYTHPCTQSYVHNLVRDTVNVVYRCDQSCARSLCSDVIDRRGCTCGCVRHNACQSSDSLAPMMSPTIHPVDMVRPSIAPKRRQVSSSNTQVGYDKLVRSAQ